ncbi:membrane protein required for colicin V production [Lutibacter oricola]|uniref:Membrane protein required for colicin V production n=1 Tax=Lutibacter oricola TaxID=762486 RepID=A0A1H3D525_9FLAO|nr:CvpA family protein [Lutibacter oricola]SDX60864.1 membrane protein required for colicin V production [Lutibacter oricola]
MNTFDIIIAVILVFGFIRGILKGLFVEVASLISLIAGIYGAIHFSYFVGEFLAQKVDWDEQYITIVSFAITFAIIVLVISLLGKLFTKMADFASLGILNKILGGVFGALKLGLILSIVLLVFNKLNNTLPFISEDQTEESILYKPIKNLAPTLFPNFIKVAEKEADFQITED